MKEILLGWCYGTAPLPPDKAAAGAAADSGTGALRDYAAALPNQSGVKAVTDSACFRRSERASSIWSVEYGLRCVPTERCKGGPLPPRQLIIAESVWSGFFFY